MTKAQVINYLMKMNKAVCGDNLEKKRDNANTIADYISSGDERELIEVFEDICFNCGIDPSKL